MPPGTASSFPELHHGQTSARCSNTVFTSFAFTVLLFPFYQGEGYAKIVKDAAEAALPGMRIWLPEVRFSLISWPSDLPLPDQFALFFSLSVLALEYLPVAWGLAMQRRYPRGYYIAEEKYLKLPLLSDVESGAAEEEGKARR